jgi:hypothetical protein
MQDAAKELYDARQFEESIEGYEKAEQYCEVALQRPEHESMSTKARSKSCTPSAS